MLMILISQKKQELELPRSNYAFSSSYISAKHEINSHCNDLL